jgi:hypothetical protein
MANNDTIDWHTAFYDAIQLELEAYEDSLTFEFEHPLNTNPLIIDAVIVKKHRNIVIKKNIAQMFRATNIIEYKSPEDWLSVSDFHKALAYTHLYCSTVEHAVINDITLSFVLNRNPGKVLEHITNICKYTISHNSGIYVVTGDIIPIQIIETKRLSGDDSLWLKELRGGLNGDMFQRIVKTGNTRLGSNHIAAYLYAILMANKDRMEELLMNERAEFEEMLVRTGVAKDLIERGREERTQEFLGLLKSGKSPEEIIKFYDKNEYKTENTVK